MLIGSIDSPLKSALATRKVPVGAADPAAGALVGATAAAAVGFAAAAVVGAAAAVVGAAVGLGAAVGAAVGAGALVGAGAAAGPQAARMLRLATPTPARRRNARLLQGWITAFLALSGSAFTDNLPGRYVNSNPFRGQCYIDLQKRGIGPRASRNL